MKTSEPFPKSLRIADRIARVVVAVILLQTLRFKFTGAPESVYIFETVGQEPWGRYGSGVVELIASILLFVPGFAAVGALLAAGTMAGAIFFHLTSLGIVVLDDGGLLFGAALLVLGAALFVLWVHRRSLPLIGKPGVRDGGEAGLGPGARSDGTPSPSSASAPPSRQLNPRSNPE